mmetsp:Transcript_937/g.2125  ORF Transcript_937/g.2125 Transcript_937/m.2125 type:complete len:411 (-) Transcript_937:150-1382(-)|eukprot:CAMPEP_0185811854 /NCGR_PEP_ID=MMETSP1322-20130828/8582_1 /TAXON_ID=265543 /ORGANISM="Minutocellus polymorphus, Strain RCC2270" /LENGTH=410 /DNA_ID=CAMNT_0028508339 /DNA_START=49 /DNA_END=1281 /DNA_ORIENTATION=-
MAPTPLPLEAAAAGASGISGAATAAASAASSSAAATTPTRSLSTTKPSSSSSSTTTALLKGGPPRPVAIRSTSRSFSVITPQSSTLLNAAVVKTDEETGEEVRLRPLSDADVLCGRGGLVNGYIGNISFRDMVAEKRDEYRDAKKKVKATIAKGIVESVQNRGGIFLRRIDIDTESGKGIGSPHKNGSGSPSKSNGGTGLDAQSSRWIDISEEKAREKTSQALREGAEVRKTSIGKPMASSSGNAAIASGSAKTKATSMDSLPPLEGGSSAATKKPRKKRKSKSSTNASLVAFLPPTVAAFLEEESSPSSGSAQYTAIKSQEDFERTVSRPKGGKLHLAQRLHLWNTSKSASERTGDWTSALGSVELWRRQVDIWVDSLAYLRSAEKQQEGDGAGTTKKAKTLSQVSVVV